MPEKNDKKSVVLKKLKSLPITSGATETILNIFKATLATAPFCGGIASLIGWHRLIIVAVLSLCCISSVACSDPDDSQMGIQIVDGVGSIGGDPENTEHQTLTYNWQLKNYNKEEVLLQWVQPNLSDELSNRLLIDDVKVNVSKIVGSGESIEVNGVITFDASGLSKQEISEECDITSLTISTESMVYIPGDKRG